MSLDRKRAVQETAFQDGEGDAYFQRNEDGSLVPASSSHPVLRGLAAVELPATGRLLDVGGAAGGLAAAFLVEHPGWSADVAELSDRAITAGRERFPAVTFHKCSITDARLAQLGDPYDVLVVSFVFHWVARSLLSRAVANVDAALVDRGVVVVSDFDPPFPRANPYVHLTGLRTYKQDYSSVFLALGTYHCASRTAGIHGTAAAVGDPYDQSMATIVLRKDLEGRYARETE